MNSLTSTLAALLRNGTPHDRCSAQGSMFHIDDHCDEDSQSKGPGTPQDKNSEKNQTHYCSGLDGDSHGVLDWYTHPHLQEGMNQVNALNKRGSVIYHYLVLRVLEEFLD